MKRNLLVLSILLSLGLIGTVVALPDLFRTDLSVDAAMRAHTIDTLVARLDEHYVFPDKAKQIAMLLRDRQHDRTYVALTDGEQFAARLTTDMASVAHDLHLKVKFSPQRLRPGVEVDAMAKATSGPARGHTDGVDGVAHLGPAIGYLRISSFPPRAAVAGAYASALDKLSDTDALIIDVRDNGGGAPESVALLISYFVDRPTRLNDIWSRDSGRTTQTWSEGALDGKRYGGRKPVVILAGPWTASAGEDFTYTMQALKRATVIGERTWGGAHPTALYRLGDHFYAAIPHSRTISPITHTNWEGSGVAPDIKAPPAAALAVAKDMLERQLGP